MAKSKLLTATLLFSVIYDVDFAPTKGVGEFRPPHKSRWTLTERGASEYEMDGWKHRKWVGVLTKQEFKDFMNHLGLYAESTETMGAIGTPAFGFGWAPAISCRLDDYEAVGSAYVTPFRNNEDTSAEKLESDFERTKKAMLAMW